jgi:hypothetical protein
MKCKLHSTRPCPKPFKNSLKLPPPTIDKIRREVDHKAFRRPKGLKPPQEETTPTTKTNGIHLATLELVVNHHNTVQPPVPLTTPTLEAPFRCKFAGTLQVMTLLLALPALPEPPTIPVELGYCPLEALKGRKVHLVEADPLVHPDHPEEAHKGHLDHLDHLVLQALQHLELPERLDYDSKRS